MSEKNNILKNRYSFMLLMEANYSNPNGDPDGDNMPRMDPQTGIGIISPVCVKHKVRNEIALLKEGQAGYKMYIAPGLSLNERDEEAIKAVYNVDDAKKIDMKKSGEKDADVLQWMCSNYFDVRAFGAVMTSFSKLPGCSHVRGPIQLGFAKSVSPIDICQLSVSRCAQTKAADREAKGDGTFGDLPVVEFGLYLLSGTIDPIYAAKTGFTEDDCDLFFSALSNLFAHDNAACRAGMRVRKLVIFKHDSPYGSARDADLFDTLTIKEKNPGSVVRSYDDYEVVQHAVPDGITLIEK